MGRGDVKTKDKRHLDKRHSDKKSADKKPMDKSSLTVGEKLKLIRKAKGITQTELSLSIPTNSSKVSLVENREDEYTLEQTVAAKKFLDIPDMPLTDLECEAFAQRLYMWHDQIRDKRMAEATELHQSMSKVVNLDPCDDNLPMLYRLFEVAFYLRQDDAETAEAKLKYLESVMDVLSIEHIYYYHHFLGSLHAHKEEYKDALKIYLKAFDNFEENQEHLLPEDKDYLRYNIAVCYSHLEKPNHVIRTIQSICKTYAGKRTTAFRLGLDGMLALNYIRVGELKEARKLLDKCLVAANSLNDKYFIAATTANYGHLYKAARKWKDAIPYFDQALGMHKPGSDLHLAALYHKIHCVIETKQFSKATKMLEQALKTYGGKDKTAIPFTALEHYQGVRKCMKSHYDYNKDHILYIEDIAIPFFIEKRANYIALDFASILEKYFSDKTHKKSLEMSKIKGRIYERITVFNGRR
jgi:tetratricopeptide (TPR) repeat protein